MARRFRAGDIVTVGDDPAEWMVLAPAGSRFRPLLCNCGWGFSASALNHSVNCESRQHFNRPATYWLQDPVTGELYRPDGVDEAVHASRLTLREPFTLPTADALAAVA